MRLSKQTIALAVTGLASLAWVGVSAAVDAGDPVLSDPVVQEETCAPVEATDAGTEATDSATDAVETTDSATDGAVEGEDEGCEPEGTDGTETTDGTEEVTDGTETTDGTEEVTDGTEATEDDTEDPAVAEHPENHGKYVSEAARETCEPGPGHGECVRAVAQSDVGKAAPEDDATEGDETVDAPEGEDDGTDAVDEAEQEDEVEGTADATAPSTHGHAAGHGKGHGRG
jgi:hypothetical protein